MQWTTSLRPVAVWIAALAAWVASLAAPSVAHAQVYAYPVPWPQSGGGTIVAVPVTAARVSVYARRDVPQGSGWDVPLTGAPVMRVDPAPAGVPIILRAPPGTPPADGDDLFVLLATAPLVISASDDERFNPGSPDRLYFVPATTGSYRGREFYGYSSAGWFANRIRVHAVGPRPTRASFSAWDGRAWVPVGALDVASGEVGVFDPPPTYPDTAYRVVTDEDALVLEGYLADNATLPAVDVTTGVTVGDDLWGYGHRYDLRAVSDLDYTIEARPEAGGPWATVTSGTLRAGARLQGDLPSRPARYLMSTTEVNTGHYVRIRTTRGRAWAIVGTVDATWNGYFLPVHSPDACVFGATFLTPGAMRSLVVLPNAGTTVRSVNEATGALVDTYTSRGPWEIHHVYDPAPLRVEITGGLGALLAVGVELGGSACNRPGPTFGALCGILEGGYTVPSLGGFQCAGGAESLTECSFVGARCAPPPPPPPDAGTSPDAASSDAAPSDAGSSSDATPSDAGASDVTLRDAGTLDALAADGAAGDGGRDARETDPTPLDAGSFADGRGPLADAASALDTSPLNQDAAGGADAAVPPGGRSAACGCRVGTPVSGAPWGGVLALVLAGMTRRRRRAA